MPRLTWITTCKGRLEHLKQTLPRVVDQPDLAWVVVDFSCPDGTADWVRTHHPQVTIVEAAGEPGFSAPRARNLGAAAARTEWLGFFDADVLLAADFSAALLPLLRPGCFFRPTPVTPPTWGSVICHAHDFAAVGGYDEAMVGWGGEDDDLYARLLLGGLKAQGFPASFVGAIEHDDAARVRFYEVKNRAVQHRINMLYLHAKLDLMRLLGQPLGLDARRMLFDQTRRSVTAALDAGMTRATLEVTLPELLIKPPPIDGIVEHWQLGRKLSYGIDIQARYVERVAA